MRMTRNCFHLWWLSHGLRSHGFARKLFCARSRKCNLRTPAIAFSELHLDDFQFLRVLSRTTFLNSNTFSFLKLSLTQLVTAIDHLWSDHLSSCQLCCHSNSKTTSVCSNRMLKTTEKMKMRLGIRVLLRSTRPNLGSATQGTLAVKDWVEHPSVSFHFCDSHLLSRLLLHLD